MRARSIVAILLFLFSLLTLLDRFAPFEVLVWRSALSALLALLTNDT